MAVEKKVKTNNFKKEGKKMAKIIMKNEIGFKYVFNSVYPLVPEVIEAMVLLLTNNLQKVKLYDYARTEGQEKVSVNELVNLSYKNIVVVKGLDENSLLETEFFFRPNTNKIEITARPVQSGDAGMKEKELLYTSDAKKEAYFETYCRSLEILAHSYVKIGESYNKLIKAARQYVDSDFDERYKTFEDDGYRVDLEFLYSPSKNK